jgi:hypothetical protein
MDCAAFNNGTKIVVTAISSAVLLFRPICYFASIYFHAAYHSGHAVKGMK